MEEKYYNVRQTANLLGIKVRTVREWIRNGKLKAFKCDPNYRWYIPETEIMRVQNEKQSR